METIMEPRRLALTYLDRWKARDFESLGRILAPDVSFRGVLGATDGLEDTLAGMRGMAEIISDFVVQRMVVEGDDVMTWYDFHTTVCESMPTVNWSHVVDGRISQVRAVFDPRPLLAAQPS